MALWESSQTERCISKKNTQPSFLYDWDIIEIASPSSNSSGNIYTSILSNIYEYLELEIFSIDTPFLTPLEKSLRLLKLPLSLEDACGDSNKILSLHKKKDHL